MVSITKMIAPLAFIAGICVASLTFLTCSQRTQPSNVHAQVNVNGYMQRSILDYGAKLDGQTDASDAIRQSLQKHGYAFIPYSPNGVVIQKTIRVGDGQRLYAEHRNMRIISKVPKDSFSILVSRVPFEGSAYVERFTLDIKTPGAKGIGVFDSRQVHVLDCTIQGNKTAAVGIQIDETGKGSAWNFVEHYNIININGPAVLLDSHGDRGAKKAGWCNRNYIGYGIAQWCDIGLQIAKGNTNTSYLCPQKCDIGIDISDQASFNIVQTMEENCGVSVKVARGARSNDISGNIHLNTKQVAGKNTQFRSLKTPEDESSARDAEEPDGN